ncbi:DEAD/DEAH box helicase family protein [Kitasatospora sp. NPDC058478]|uniref:DEAD/DEAH box helicase family protein n=1 Tax=unclassified Kitasatospora TaxID=2633591 RepID=UPI003655FA47
MDATGGRGLFLVSEMANRWGYYLTAASGKVVWSLLLIWHHQGSGKTLLMVFAASLLLADARTESPTIILLSDRTQLVRQTSKACTSAMGDSYFHRPATSQALHSLLADDVGGVISTTVHKFADAGKDLGRTRSRRPRRRFWTGSRLPSTRASNQNPRSTPPSRSG